MSVDAAKMNTVIHGLETWADKIRALNAAGYSRSEIAKFLGKRYQHVRNVLVQSGPIRSAPDAPSGAQRMKLQVGPGGRIVIPADVRQAMGIEEGSTLFCRFEKGELTLGTAQAVMKRVQAAVRQYVPEGVSLVDELIADRRREAAKEEEGV